MKNFYCLFITLLFNSVFAQQSGVIDFEALPIVNENSVILKRSSKGSLKPGDRYSIKIKGVNNAYTILKLKTKSMEIYTPIPEVLKTVLPGVAGSQQVGIVPKFTETDEIGSLNFRIGRLKKIKEESKVLYDGSLFKANTALATRILDGIKQLYNNSTDGAIADSVYADIQYLLAAKRIFDSSVQNTPSIEPLAVRTYASINTISEELIKNNYLAYLNFIKKSTEAEDFVTSKSFLANKDLVELNIILIDTYTNDTLVNDVKTVYTKSSGASTVGLSFSTGFFYTEGFSDQPYYLRTRSDETVAVLPDKRQEWDVSIGGVGHLFWKFSSFLRMGPSLGISISPFDGKSRYLLGGSFLLGKEKMLSLTVGNAWAKRKELSAAVLIDSEGVYLPKGSTTVPMYDRIVDKMFVGLTYNISSTRK